MAAVSAAFLVLAISLSAAAAPPTPQATTAFDKKIISNISVPNMLANLKVLTEEIGPRVAASPESWKGIEFLKSVYEGYGYDTQIQYVPGSKNYVAYIKMLSPTEQRVWVRVGSYSPSTPPLTPAGGITGLVVDCGLGNSPDDFPPEVQGNIALVRRAETAPGSGVGESSSVVTQKIRNAQAAKAAAVAIYNFDWHIFSASTGRDASITIPFATMNSEAGALMVPGGTANFQINFYQGSANLIAFKRPTDKKFDTGKIMVISAHSDTVPTSPGANDSGAGLVVTAELARIMADLPVDTEVRFAAWTDEESGMVGSRYYVASLSEEERSRHIVDYQMDMIGTSWSEATHLFLHTLLADPSDPTKPRPSLVSDSVFAAEKRMGLYDTPMNGGLTLRGASDHQAFNEVGISAANIVWKLEPTIREPVYHNPWDDITHNISWERVKLGAEIVGAAAYDVARPDTPSLENSATR